MNQTSHSLPAAFEERMKASLGPEYASFIEAIALPPPTSIRINDARTFPTPAGTPVPWCSSGIYLHERPSFTLDPNFHAGGYYVQESSSMFLEQAFLAAMDRSRAYRVLDLSAAPGGKSTHLLSLLSRESLLVSNEVIRSRASILSENIQKWGRANVLVTNNDPKHFERLNGFFDLVVVDAPCSGEGLFRKDREAADEWSVDNVQLCAARQRRILTDVWPSLKQGGVLIYCTCTYNEEENESNLQWLAEHHDVEFLKTTNDFPGVLRSEKGAVVGYRFMPHKVSGEGFFLSIIRKRDSSDATRIRRSNYRPSKTKTDWLQGDFRFYEHNELLIAVPESNADDIEFLAGELNVVTRGVAVATIARNKLIPEHSLALSANINPSSFPTIDLDRSRAIDFLAKEPLDISGEDRGFALVRFEGSNLGFVNRIGNRVNNLYPANWRIRKRIKN